jgi:hypothetical protein
MEREQIISLFWQLIFPVSALEIISAFTLFETLEILV